MKDKMAKPEKFIWIVLLLLSIAAAVVKVLVGFDIDEGYAISMPQRLLQGDHLFLDMWEVHQTSAFLPAIFMWLYELVTDSTQGMVIYLRMIASILHFAMSILVFRTSKDVALKWRLLIALLYFNFLPKWMMTLDFSMQQIWGMTCVVYFLSRMMNSEKKVNTSLCSFFCGVFLAMTVLAYPGMVVVYPFIILYICTRKDEVKTKFNKILFVTCGCAVMAIAFFSYLLCYMDVSQLIESIPLVFMDGTHQFTMATKLMAYGKQWMNVGKQLIILAVPSGIVYVIGTKVLKNKLALKKEDGIVIWLCAWMLVTSLLIILANVAGLAIGPFHFQVRYLGFFLGVLIWGYELRKQSEVLYWNYILITLVSFIGILVFSNVGPDSSSSYLVLGVIGGYLLLYENVKGNVKLDSVVWITGAIFVLSLIFCKGYYVRITEYGPSNITERRIEMQCGPMQGIYMLPDDYNRNLNDGLIVEMITANQEKMLFLGTEGIHNLSAQGIFVSPSTISTPAFNEQWTLYFTKYPEKSPDVIVIAKNTVDNREKFLTQNPLGIWISENYDTMHMEETESLCIIRR